METQNDAVGFRRDHGRRKRRGRNDDDDPNALAIVPNGEENDEEKECDESVYSISTLSTHASDLVVRPIVNNRRVEPNGSAMDPVHGESASVSAGCKVRPQSFASGTRGFSDCCVSLSRGKFTNALES